MSLPDVEPGLYLTRVPIELVRPNPRQPRKVFDEDALGELAESVRAVGVLQPVVVRPAGDGFELVMGERRWRAARLAGLSELPALVRRTDDTELLRLALLENVHRSALNPLEEAAAYRQLVDDFGCTHEDLAAHLGTSRSHVTHTLALLRLPPAVQRRVAAGVLSAGHAKALVAIRDPYVAELLAGRVVAEGLSVRATEEIVASGSLPGAEALDGREDRWRARGQARARVPDPELAQLAGDLADRLDTRVLLKAGRTKGRLVVEFSDRADLHRILTELGLAAGRPSRA